MTNPHEQEWEHDGRGVVWNKGRLADLVHQPTPGHAQSEDEVKARGALISAAPDMARALLEVLERVQLSPSRAATIAAALKKAGVL